MTCYVFVSHTVIIAADNVATAPITIAYFEILVFVWASDKFSTSLLSLFSSRDSSFEDSHSSANECLTPLDNSPFCDDDLTTEMPSCSNSEKHSF